MVYLASIFKLRYHGWIGDKGQIGSALDNLVNFHSELFGKVTQDGEDGESGKERGKGVSYADDQSISVDILPEVAMRPVVDQ